jgi:hypothetical protein
MRIKGMPETPVQTESAPAQMFDGRFFITNPYEVDHVCKWNGVEYLFKSMTTSPLMIMDANPIETQNIRRKFAEEIGTAAFMRSKDYKKLQGMEVKNKGAGVPTYASAKQSNSPLAPYIQRCLEPLPVVPAKVTKREKRDPELKRDEHGKQVIRLLDHDANGSYSFEEEARNAVA